MFSAGREAVLMSIVHACPYLVVSLIALFSTSRLRTGPGPGKFHAPCTLSTHALLLEMIVAASQVAVSLGYIPPPCSSSISYSLAPQSDICDHPGLAFFSFSVQCDSSVRVLDAASRAIYGSVSLRLFIFHRASLQGRAPSS